MKWLTPLTYEYDCTSREGVHYIAAYMMDGWRYQVMDNADWLWFLRGQPAKYRPVKFRYWSEQTRLQPPPFAL